LGTFPVKGWNHFAIELKPNEFSVSVNKEPAQTFKKSLLRKICFGGLYVPPEWPIGKSQSSDVRLKLDSIVVQ
jgi:hypothetical protein